MEQKYIVSWYSGNWHCIYIGRNYGSNFATVIRKRLESRDVRIDLWTWLGGLVTRTLLVKKMEQMSMKQDLIQLINTNIILFFDQ
jgi:hypothetical protein